MMSDDDNDGQMIFGELVGLKLPAICLTGEEKHQKNLTQETCPDQGSNSGPLRDRRACYHLVLSSGAQKTVSMSFPEVLGAGDPWWWNCIDDLLFSGLNY